MTYFARLAAFCVLAASPLALPHLVAQAPVVIERAPENPGEISREEVETLRAENERLAADLEAKRLAIERLSADLDSAQAARAQHEGSLKEAARELGTLRAQLARAQAAPAPAAIDPELQKKLADTQGTIDVLVSKNQQLDSTLAARTAELREIRAALEAAKTQAQDNSAAKTAESAAAAAIAREKARADEATARLAAFQADSTRLQQELATLQTQLASARQADTALREQLAAATKPAAQTPDLSAKLADTEAKLAEATRAAAQSRAENERLTAAAAEHTRASADLQALRQENSALQTQLAQARETEAGLRQQLAAPPTPAASTEPSPEFAARLATAESKLETVLRSYSLLQKENETLKTDATQVAQLQAELQTLRDDKAALEARVATTAAAEPPPDLAQKLADTEDRLSTALRSFSLLQAENERLKADTTRALETVQATAAKSSSDSAAQMAALFDELRQTKAQLTSLVAENSQLRTRLAIAGPPPGSLLASPSRPGAAVAPATVPVDVPSSPAPAAARTHVVALGDTLGKISRQYYGTPARWEEILRANRDLVANENALPVGITLRIP